MLSMERLNELSEADLREGLSDDLPNLLEVTIEGTTPIQRFESYVKQVKNPYLFRVGCTPVRISFSGEKPIEETIKQHFLLLKSKEI